MLLETHKTAFIVNPYSGSTAKDNVLTYIDYRYGQYGYDHTVYFTKAPGDAFEEACKFIDNGYDTIVAVGGDGTVNEVGRAVAEATLRKGRFINTKTKNLRLGIIPFGSGNGLARHLGIEPNDFKSVEYILQGRTNQIDLGYVQDKYFLSTAGVGFDAQVGHEFNKASRRGLFPYAAITMRELSHYKKRHYIISTPDILIERDAFLITFANSSQWGFNLSIAPKASLYDGYLDVIIWKKLPVFETAIMAIELLQNKIQEDGNIEVIRCKHFSIERATADYVHFDGETAILPALLNVGVVQSAIKVIVP